MYFRTHSSLPRQVGRAESLLHSLDQEKVRWQQTSSSFDLQMSTLIGDSLLASAFLTYAGVFDHRMRSNLMLEWSETLETLGVPYRTELDITSYLSTPSEQMRWRGFGLPTDELATQNAILLERFNRYPMVVDPSGQAAAFILQKFSAQKITQTSFLDSAFLKNLGSAIRFGTPLLINDVETVDPVLNPILNKELQKTGGRTLIRLGNEDIDFSPKFFLVLTTRNPLAHFAPDLCSRVTMINFTVTPASLESQTLSAILKAERPDVDARRTQVLRLQGEQSAKLRELEEALLNKISAVQGAILDDDSVINTLEKIKSEAAELNTEVMKTQEIMDEVRAASAFYEPLAVAMAAVYFAMEKMADVSFLYQFSLEFFLEIVERVLTQAAATAATSSVGTVGPVASGVSSTAAAANAEAKVAAQRVKELSLSFFGEVSRRVMRALKYSDKLMFLVRMGQIATQGQTLKELSDSEADVLFRGAAISLLDVDSTAGAARLQKFREAIPGRSLDESVARYLLSLTLLPSFGGLQASMASSDPIEHAKWLDVLDGPEPEKSVPLSWATATGSGSPREGSGVAVAPERAALLIVMIIRALRPERTLHALEGYITAVFGDSFAWREHAKLDLRQLVETDSNSRKPVMICSEAGQDASSKVDSLAAAMGMTLLQVQSFPFLLQPE